MYPKRNEGRSNDLYLVVFKPHGFFHLYPFQADQIEAKRLFKIIRNSIDCMNCPSESPERTVAGNPHQAARWQDVHPMLFYLPLLSVCFAVLTEISWYHARNHNHY